MGLDVAFVGSSGAGKTTLLERLVSILAGRGYKVAVVKHAAHGYEVDVPGKDSRRHFEAGAHQVAVVGPSSFTVHTRLSAPLRRAAVRALFRDADFLLLEGFKDDPGPKVAVLREGEELPADGEVVAVVSPTPRGASLPWFAPADAAGLADFLIALKVKAG